MAKSVAVVGASGFIGKNMCKYAVDKGCEVLGIEGDEKLYRLSKIEDANYFRGIKLDTCDLKDTAVLARKLKGTEIVYDFVGRSDEHAGTYEDVNVGLTGSIVEACREAGVKVFVYNSGLGIAHFGDSRFPRVQNKYFESLKKAEKVIMDSGIDYTIFRPSYVVGVGDLFTKRIMDQLGKRKVWVISTGQEPMQPISIFDAAEIYYKCADNRNADTSKKIIDLVGPEQIGFLDYVAAVASWMTLRDYSLEKISIEDAKTNPPDDLKRMSPEQVDIRVCGEVSDHAPLEKMLGRKLRSVKLVPVI